jgi:beta-galactosidase
LAKSAAPVALQQSRILRMTQQGPGEIAGVDNGNPTNHESFKAKQHKAFHGFCLAVIKASRTPGEVRLDVRAEGLKSEPVVTTTIPPVAR